MSCVGANHDGMGEPKQDDDAARERERKRLEALAKKFPVTDPPNDGKPATRFG